MATKKDEKLMDIIERNTEVMSKLMDLLLVLNIDKVGQAGPPTQVDPAPAEVPAEEPKGPSEKPTMDDARTALKRYAGAFGRDKAVEFLATFGEASTMKDVDPKSYESFIFQIEEALNEAGDNNAG